jgi:hypothetical protein
MLRIIVPTVRPVHTASTRFNGPACRHEGFRRHCRRGQLQLRLPAGVRCVARPGHRLSRSERTPAGCATAASLDASPGADQGQRRLPGSLLDVLAEVDEIEFDVAADRLEPRGSLRVDVPLRTTRRPTTPALSGRPARLIDALTRGQRME